MPSNKKHGMCRLVQRYSIPSLLTAIENYKAFIFDNPHDDGYSSTAFDLEKLKVGEAFLESIGVQTVRPDYLLAGKNGILGKIAEQKIGRTKERRKAKAKAGPKSGCVYLMSHSRNHLTKIGFSRDPKAREGTLQGEDPELSLAASWVSNTNAEKDLHQRFAHKRVRGEWFKLDTDDIAIIENIMGGAK